MGVVLDDSPGERVLLYGADGSTLLKVVVDAAGHLQVDTLTSALPSGAATEATLAEANARLGDEVGPAAGSVNKQLADLLTELQSVLDAAARLYGYNGAAWANLLVESAASPNLRVGLWDGASRAQVYNGATEPMSASDQGVETISRLYALAAAGWRRLRIDGGDHLYVNQFGVPTVERQSTTAASAGTNTFNFTAVAAAKVWNLKNICIVNMNSASGGVVVQVVRGATAYNLYTFPAMTAGNFLAVVMDAYLAAADNLRIVWYNCTLNDDLYIDINYVLRDA